ncbi:MAG: 50S ribosomal protein L21 [Candidatus Loosdrechtia sp.]|uniref:bL21 family ribosomal protein n=1 Tax=Candidatus Loosdrechtia sp. TaxID=3101272 RepID=UPI003A6915A1|nr:MAG: 50S ribosomal protein L21 [Candidatus Jettenia sp. AMX2]WKZ22050.1 MAG: 50S ribosomal protein L21 [Candidatus Jettenia sp. AMX2]
MYAIIKDRGKQYKVRVGERHLIDLKANAEIGETLEFSDVLVCSDEKNSATFGISNNKNAKVIAEVEGIKKGIKSMTIKFRRRKESMSRRGHREKYTQIKVREIVSC